MEESYRRNSGGSGRLSSPSAMGSAQERRTSYNQRDSQASNGTNDLASNRDSHTRSQSIAFVTADHGVVSVDVTDLSNVLGVRRGDLVSRRVTFQALSAPSHRTDRSLLGSALASSSLVGGNAAAAVTAASPTTGAWSNSTVLEVQGSSTTHSDSDNAVTVTLPFLSRPAHYQRRRSTLRGTQLGEDPLAPSMESTQSPGLMPTTSTGDLLFSQRALSRRGTPPPPGGENVLRRALAGNLPSSSTFMVGSVPSPLLCSEGLLWRAGLAPAAPPSLNDRHSSSSNDNRGSGRGWGEEADGNGQTEAESDHDENDEKKGLLFSSHRHGATAQHPDVQERDRISLPCRRSLSSAATSRSNGTSPPPPPPSTLQMGDVTANAAEGGSATSPSRSVHFSENVIESISVARGDDEYMRLLVVYSRPWYAYLLLGVFGFLFGLFFVSVFYLEREQTPVIDRAASVPFMFFLMTVFGAVWMLLHLVAVWRPGSEEEQKFFEDPEQRGQLLQLWMVGLLFIGGLTISLIFSHAIGSTVAVVMAVGLVGHVIAEWTCGGDEESGDCVSCWDVVGSLVVCVGALLTTASGVAGQLTNDGSQYKSLQSSLQDGQQMLLGLGISVFVSGICWALFTRRMREMSKRVSQQFLLTSSLSVCTAVLGIAAYVVNVLRSSDANTQTSNAVNEEAEYVLPSAFRLTWIAKQREDLTGALVPCYSWFPDFAILLGGVLCYLLCWYAYYMVSFYVDHIASAACMVVGATVSTVPLISLLTFHTWPSSKHEFQADVLGMALGGMLALVLGAGMVVYGGVRYRREVEIRIVVE